MTALGAREAYRLWAPTYSDETAISHLEAKLAAEMTPSLAGLRLLDAGCGTARRLRGAGAAFAVGVDLSGEMIGAGQSGARVMVADIRLLPLADETFDVVWCRLVIGHLPECAVAYAELARVSVPGGLLIVTDFHAAAVAAGHRRTFRARDAVHEAEHFVHDAAAQLAAARAAGFALVEAREAAIGPEARPFYVRAGRLALYEEHRGLPVVLGLAFRRAA